MSIIWREQEFSWICQWKEKRHIFFVKEFFVYSPYLCRLQSGSLEYGAPAVLGPASPAGHVQVNAARSGVVRPGAPPQYGRHPYRRVHTKLSGEREFKSTVI